LGLFVFRQGGLLEEGMSNYVYVLNFLVGYGKEYLIDLRNI